MPQYQVLLDHVPVALLVIFRIGGLMLYGPLLGSPVIPARVKVLLTVLLGVAVYPVLAAGPLAGYAPPELALWTLAPLVVMELLVGMTIGFVASIPLIAIQTGGLVMGQQMGMGFAQLFNPAIESEGDVLGQMLFVMIVAGFLLIGGHEAMLLAVMHSFDHIGPGRFAVDLDLLALLAGLMTSAFELALRVAAPLLAMIFLESAAMGFIAKTVPQLNILSFGFPLRILAGLLIIVLGLAVIDQVMMEEMERVLELLFEFDARRSFDG